MRPRPLSPDEPGQIAGHRLISVLGEGGQGVVYLGEAPAGTRVAIKLLHVRAALDAESRRRFLREADTARRVAPFCTTRVLDVGAFHDRPYVISEYVPGASLAEAVATGGPRTGSGLQRLAVATLTALAAIHRAGVVHRDFKPGNVILGPEGPVVIDFGIARVGDQSTVGSGLVGTPAYIAPEELHGQPPSPASDVFSWACTMAYAATGRLAFTGTTIPALLLAISTREPDLSGVPDELRPLLADCLAKDPAARPTAAALLLGLTGDDRTADVVRTLPAGGTRDARTADGGGRDLPVHGGTTGGVTAPVPPGPAPGPRETAELERPGPGGPSGDVAGTAVRPGGATGSGGSSGSSGQPTIEGPGPGRPRRSRARRLVPGLVAVLAAVLVTVLVVLPRIRSSTGAEGVTATGTLLYDDTFGDRGNWDGYTFAPDAEGDARTTHGYEIDRGVYSIRADPGDPDGSALSPVPAKNPSSPSAVERDVMIGVTAELREGSTGPGAFGLLCRWDEEVPNGYAFTLGLDGTARIVRNAQGTRLDVAPPVRIEAPGAGRKVRVQAACRGTGARTRLTMWVDGTQVIDVTDPQTLPDSQISQVGLVARVPESGGGVITVCFDDFSVHRTTT
ncbi:serine/threonine-protein kinase [Sphaerisporangium corydalis]|uniref:non-specific serine/threonine protein kinase n=1 Tax=Sphaerisporangium corydalis TaxID=1441875 RepID=A0ABV9EPV8_9ACTN|nr:serine/threonine-protein kinase [Sphaerisporangium corydalis]